MSLLELRLGRAARQPASGALPWAPSVGAPAAAVEAPAPQDERFGPHVIVAGECAAGDALTVRAEPEVVARVDVGQEIDLVYRYRFERGQEERDFFRVALVSRVGGTAPPPRLFQTQAKRGGVHDGLRGYLVHRYAFRAPGVYEGGFALRAETLAQSRATGDVVHWATATREGAVRVLVGDVGYAAPAGRTEIL